MGIAVNVYDFYYTLNNVFMIFTTPFMIFTTPLLFFFVLNQCVEKHRIKKE